MNRKIIPLLLGVSGLLASLAPTGQAADANWPYYRGDEKGTGYSSLDRINRSNVTDLQPAWTHSLRADTADARSPNSQLTPIVVNNVMYVVAADRIMALDPVSGLELWRHPINGDAPSRRGLAYWPGNDRVAPRLLVTAGSALLAINAASGVTSEDFGTAGSVDLGIPYNSVPLVYDDVVIVGANTPRGAAGGIGNPRAYDARSGDPLWEFSSVAQPGDPGHETWEGDSWRGRLGANAWPFYFTVDAERDLLYVPLAAPLPFAYGGDRPGANLYANAVVAVNLHSGDYAWHFQTIHHDLWDHDPPAPPTLFDIPAGNGRATAIAALAVTTKSGYLYILNRETGEPVYPVEERPVPRSDVPGEQSYPTQPIPSVIPPLARTSYTAADLVRAEDTSAEHAAACQALVANNGELINDGPFTPWAYRPQGNGNRTTLLFPGLTGGPNWGGVTYDPDTAYVVGFAQDLGAMGWVEEALADADSPFVLRGPRPSAFDVAMGDSRWPCQRPPWGRLTAVDTRTGAVVWTRPLGVTDGLPADKQNTGRPGRAGAIATAGGLLFIAGTDDARLRALDIATGEELWVTQLAAQGNANPMTYLGYDGRQYVVIVASDQLVAFAL